LEIHLVYWRFIDWWIPYLWISILELHEECKLCQALGSFPNYTLSHGQAALERGFL